MARFRGKSRKNWSSLVVVAVRRRRLGCLRARPEPQSQRASVALFRRCARRLDGRSLQCLQSNEAGKKRGTRAGVLLGARAPQLCASWHATLCELAKVTQNSRHGLFSGWVGFASCIVFIASDCGMRLALANSRALMPGCVSRLPTWQLSEMPNWPTTNFTSHAAKCWSA